MTNPEISESGNPIFRYENVKQKDFVPAFGNNENIEAISNHIEKNIGIIESVFHEMISDLIHIDIFWVKPTEKFPFHTLITSGMSEKPMNTPQELKNHQFAELCILLPKEWLIDNNGDSFKNENNYWPIRWLKIIARFPHKYDTWLSHGHTIPNGENADPFSENTTLGCMLLLPSIALGDDFYELKINDDKNIKFYCLYPIYKEEMDFKLKKGTDELMEKFDRYGVEEIVNVSRQNTCLKKGLFGLW